MKRGDKLVAYILGMIITADLLFIVKNVVWSAFGFAVVVLAVTLTDSICTAIREGKG